MYTYSLRPVHMELKDNMHIGNLGSLPEQEKRASMDVSAIKPPAAEGGSSGSRNLPPIVNWELRLVMEYCDQVSPVCEYLECAVWQESKAFFWAQPCVCKVAGIALASQPGCEQPVNASVVLSICY